MIAFAVFGSMMMLLTARPQWLTNHLRHAIAALLGMSCDNRWHKAGRK